MKVRTTDGSTRVAQYDSIVYEIGSEPIEVPEIAADLICYKHKMVEKVKESEVVREEEVVEDEPKKRGRQKKSDDVIIE